MESANNRPNNSYDNLTRQARRARRVFERHADGSALIASHGETLLPAIDRFDATRSRTHTLRLAAGEAGDAARAQGKRLAVRTNGWIRRLAIDVPKLDTGAHLITGTVVDDAVSKTEHALAMIGSLDAERVRYLDAMRADIQPELEAAIASLRRTQDALASEQAVRAEGREAGRELERELIGLRATLRSELGSTHRDYQKLRNARVHVPDPDDETPERTSAPAELPVGEAGFEDEAA